MKKILILILMIIIILSTSVYAYVSNYSTRSTLLPREIDSPHEIPATGTIKVGFSPNGGVEQALIEELTTAQSTIEVQAYSFTSVNITRTLINAYKQGIKVRVILDKSQVNEKYSGLKYLRSAGIPVHIDHGFNEAHTKSILVDHKTLITGSYNFTKNAEEHNNEVSMIFYGNQPLVDLFLTNWTWRWNATDNY